MSQIQPPSSKITGRWAMTNFLFAFVPFVVASGAIMLSRLDGTIALVWPVNAVIVALMLYGDRSLKPAYGRLACGIIGVIAANISLGFGPLSIGFGLANELECMVVFFGLRVVGQAIDQNPDDLFSVLFGVMVAATAPFLSAIVASGVLSLATGDVGGNFYLEWALSDLLGLVIFMPAIFLATSARSELREISPGLGLAALVPGIGVGTLSSGDLATLGILLAFPLAFSFAVFGSLAAGFAFVLSLFGTLTAMQFHFGNAPPIGIIGSEVFDFQIIVALIALSTLLAALISMARDKASQQREDALRALAEQTETAIALQSAIHQMSDAVVLLDPDLNIVEFNQPFLRFHPRSATQISRGQSFEDFLKHVVANGEYAPTKSQEEDWLSRRLSIVQTRDTEFEERLSDGRYLLVRERGLANGGRVIHFLDITLRKRLERELREKTARAEAAVKAKDQFIANMSHELRTPMNGVLGMVQALLHSDLPSSQNKMAAVIVQSGKVLMGLLNDLMDFAQIEAGGLALDVGPIVPAQLLQSQLNLFEPLAAEKGITLCADLGTDLDQELVGDGKRLAQVVSNLLANAIKFSSQGDIVLSAALKSTDDPDSEVLEFGVADRGPGVPPGDRDRIFVRYEQSELGSRSGGVGLGLSICKTICEMHRGTIQYVERPGGGALFLVSLKLDRAVSPRAEVTAVGA